jgi:hypothetical protein
MEQLVSGSLRRTAHSVRSCGRVGTRPCYRRNNWQPAPS